MKIQIRKSCFETNSSSSHAIILTNEKDCDNDVRAKQKYLEDFRGYCGKTIPKLIKTKNDKVILLSALFDYSINDTGYLQREKDVLINILKDNNEEELLEIIEQNKKEYLEEHPDTPICRKFFFDDVLNECNCFFNSVFKKYFQIEMDMVTYFHERDNNNPKLTYKEFVDNQKKKLYDKLYKFIYEDGVIIPYEYL